MEPWLRIDGLATLFYFLSKYTTENKILLLYESSEIIKI